jgi:hypothetical protein
VSTTDASDPTVRGAESPAIPAPAGPADDAIARLSASPAETSPVPDSPPAADRVALPARDPLSVPDPPPAGDPAALPDLASLTPESDFRPFMRAGVDSGQRNAALHKLFTDPHYNQMDGLDVYIDDYSRPDPIPPAMLRMLNQARTLGLFGAEDPAPDAAADGARGAAGGSVAGESAAPDSPGAEAAAGQVPADAADAEGPQVDRADPIASEHDGAIAADARPDLEPRAPASQRPGSAPTSNVPPVG